MVEGNWVEDWMVPIIFLDAIAKTRIENGTPGVKSIASHLVLLRVVRMDGVQRSFVALLIALHAE
jgi:hypothetical protein